MIRQYGIQGRILLVYKCYYIYTVHDHLCIHRARLSGYRFSNPIILKEERGDNTHAPNSATDYSAAIYNTYILNASIAAVMKSHYNTFWFVNLHIPNAFSYPYTNLATFTLGIQLYAVQCETPQAALLASESHFIGCQQL